MRLQLHFRCRQAFTAFERITETMVRTGDEAIGNFRLVHRHAKMRTGVLETGNLVPEARKKQRTPFQLQDRSRPVGQFSQLQRVEPAFMLMRGEGRGEMHRVTAAATRSLAAARCLVRSAASLAASTPASAMLAAAALSPGWQHELPPGLVAVTLSCPRSD